MREIFPATAIPILFFLLCLGIANYYADPIDLFITWENNSSDRVCRLKHSHSSRTSIPFRFGTECPGVPVKTLDRIYLHGGFGKK